MKAARPGGRVGIVVWRLGGAGPKWTGETSSAPHFSRGRPLKKIPPSLIAFAGLPRIRRRVRINLLTEREMTMMKSLTTKLLAVAALTLAALLASSMYATGADAQTGNHKYYSLVVVTGAEGYDLQWTDGRVVGLRALRQDGSWFDLRPQVPPPAESPTTRAYCEGWDKELYCYEDDEKQMSVCVCVDTIAIGPGPVAGPVINSWEFVKKTAR